jgi:hypothetical protein
MRPKKPAKSIEVGLKQHTRARINHGMSVIPQLPDDPSDRQRLFEDLFCRNAELRQQVQDAQQQAQLSQQQAQLFQQQAEDTQRRLDELKRVLDQTAADYDQL